MKYNIIKYLRSVISIAFMETKVSLRTPIALFWTFIYPFALFVILNIIFGGGRAPSGYQISYSDYLITGIIVMTILSVSLFSLLAVLVEQRSSGGLLLYASMPLTKTSFFIGLIISRFIVLIIFCFLFIVSLSFFIAETIDHSVVQLLQIGVFLGAGAFAVFGISLNIASLIKKTATVHALANIINLPIIFLSDLFLPVDLFPEPFANFLKQLPPYLYVDYFRGFYGGDITFVSILPMVFALIFAGLFLVWFASWHFKWWVSN